LLPPDILKSEDDFSIEGDNIRFGLAGIKSLNDLNRIHDFINRKTANKFEVFQAAKEAKLNIGVFTNVIYAGALNSLGSDRLKLVLEAKIWNQLNDREKNYCLLHGAKYNFELIEMLKNYEKWIDGSLKKFTIKRLETIRRDTAKYIEEWRKNSKYPEFSAYFFEKKLLGYSYSHTLKEVFKKNRPDLLNIQEVKNVDLKNKFSLMAEVRDVKKGKSKAGNAKLEIFVADETGEFRTMLTGDRAETAKIPEKEDIVMICGTKAEELGWIDSLEIQTPFETV
jgi:DNA polymerase III alpha subunit